DAPVAASGQQLEPGVEDAYDHVSNTCSHPPRRLASRLSGGCYLPPWQALPTCATAPRSTTTWRLAWSRPRESVHVSVHASFTPVSTFGSGERKVTLPPNQSSGVFITWS